MDMPAWLPSLIGGMMIGLSATLLMAFNGRIAGISGIFSGLLTPRSGDTLWRATFVSGLVLGGVLLAWVHPAALPESLPRSPLTLAIAGLLVGFGVRMGSGCTSGHGVCGIGRRSPRSLAATLTFITTGAIAVLIAKALGGAL